MFQLQQVWTKCQWVYIAWLIQGNIGTTIIPLWVLIFDKRVKMSDLYLISWLNV